MNKTQKFTEKRLFLILFIGLFIILMLPLTFVGYFFLNAHSNIITFNEFVKLSEEITEDTDGINSFLQGVHGNVLFLSELSSLNDVINSDDEGLKGKYKTDLENDFLSFSNEKKIFHQIRYIDENGQEIVKIQSEKGTSEIIHDNFQNKKDRYYFTEAVNLESGKIFISPLDLNVEYDEIENRGTEENPAYVPVIRYATPVFDSKGNSKGIVIINIYAEYFLEHIHNEQQEGKLIFLLNNNGFYLSHPVFEKEFGFMFGNNETIYNDYPIMASNLLSNKENEILKLGESLVAFRYIYPNKEILEAGEQETQVKQEIKSLSTKGTIKNMESDKFWVLVSIESKEDVFSYSEKLKNEFLLIILSTMFIVGLAFGFFIILIFKRLRRSKK